MKSYKEYLGIFLGALYALVFRVLGGIELLSGSFSIYSITFIWIVPLLVGIIPILVARKEMGNSLSKYFLYPFLSGLIFAVLALSTRLEDVLCILILGMPFIAGAGTVGLFLGIILKSLNDKKRRNDKNLYSLILLVPLFLNPLESLLPSPKKEYQVKQQIIIHASKEKIWKNIIEVPEIKEGEYEYSFFNYIGVPRPVKSTFETIDGKIYRVGYFSDELKLIESISTADSLKHVAFTIHLEKSQLRDLPMDKHILESKFFRFNTISYQLTPTVANTVVLTLSCTYTIESKMNGYANFWAEKVIGDFENNLLKSLKLKIEQ